ncbi:dubious [Schizosaccharomyces pombe]|uniref:Uncharacterized protein C4F11.05 n=1 Tax=Schizosaccharomyces pombe (strain 972 / ATCC 24843) TaxID=284812 RepID=YQA5_SCHPO|nr:uncharacterized protein SPCC4F11.05 [Schizosaccharomyces pombe]Q9UT66.1 RecName: Full=Uncharacterized protein C4F11.05 [Schizosaccharomyces pombe 972h-]CAB55771.1 dubious [Schizosaccharomyces pombe]|eukprot:NP_588404.1 uncharacterized protein SPCC4F11.05 [Schizosaccharomyces pombe]
MEIDLLSFSIKRILNLSAFIHIYSRYFRPDTFLSSKQSITMSVKKPYKHPNCTSVIHINRVAIVIEQEKGKKSKQNLIPS